MNHAASAALLVAALAAPALAHGGGYAGSPNGGGGGPQAGPGVVEPAGPVTRWESWWQDNREDLLRLAERVDSARGFVVTPSPGDGGKEPDAARTRAVLAAGVRDDVLPQLLWALREDDFDVRGSAAIALGKLGDARGAEPLKTSARHDERAEVRRAAVLGLGLLGRRQELPFLCDLVADRKAELDERSMAALAAGLLGGDDAACFLSFFVEKPATRPDPKSPSEAQFAGTIYAALGLTDSIEALRTLWRAADDPELDPFLRAHAVLSLGRLRDRESTDRFLRLIAPGNDLQLRRAAVAALGRVTTAADATPLGALRAIVLAEKDPIVRRFAIEALGGVRDPDVRARLRLEFDRAPAAERPLFALALAVQGDAAAAPAIRGALKAEKEESWKAAYCTSLGLLADRDAIPILEREISSGPSPGTYRGFAALALAVIPSPGSREALWKRLPEEHDARVWGDYSIALGLLGDGRVRGYLEKQLKDGDGNFDKCRAASCLGVLRRADGMPVLVEVLHNRFAPGIVRALCVVALGQIADPSLVPKLARIAAGGDSSLATRTLAEAMTIL